MQDGNFPVNNHSRKMEISLSIFCAVMINLLFSVWAAMIAATQVSPLSSGIVAPGNQLHRPLWSSLYYNWTHGLSTTLQGWVSPITRKGLSLLPRDIWRHQHLPLGRQSRSPERSTTVTLCFSAYARLFRTLHL